MSEKKEFSVVYENAKTAPTIPVTGAIGGFNPNTDLVYAHIYVEHTSLPSVSTHPFIDENSISMDPKDADEVKMGNITRKILGTLVLSPRHAVILGEWLVDNGSKAIKEE